MKRDPMAEIEVGIRGDTAAALGQAGRRLKSAVGALTDGREREEKLRAVAEALWAYIVQREAIGITDHTEVSAIYGLTPEVCRLLGVMPAMDCRPTGPRTSPRP